MFIVTLGKDWNQDNTKKKSIREAKHHFVHPSVRIEHILQ